MFTKHHWEYLKQIITVRELKLLKRIDTVMRRYEKQTLSEAKAKGELENIYGELDTIKELRQLLEHRISISNF
jgi:hypothetical protein